MNNKMQTRALNSSHAQIGSLIGAISTNVNQSLQNLTQRYSVAEDTCESFSSTIGMEWLQVKKVKKLSSFCGLCNHFYHPVRLHVSASLGVKM